MQMHPYKQGLTQTQKHNSATNNNHNKKRGNTTDINLCFNTPSQIHRFLIAVAKEVDSDTGAATLFEESAEFPQNL